MPPPLLFDLDQIDLSRNLLNQEQIYQWLPHRYEFRLLENICYVDLEAKRIVAYRDIRADDWWFRGHVPGRPLVPGVLMLEMAAHLSAIIAHLSGLEGFVGFGAVDDCRFRLTVSPPCRLYILGVARQIRPRRVISDTQAVVDGQLAFEARITGLTLR